MLDDFFTRAVIGGVLIALLAGPLGCIIVWRRMSYFGDTLAHAALLGVAGGLLLGISSIWAVFVVCTLIAVLLALLQKRSHVSPDALLGIFAHSALALSLIALSFMPDVRVDLPALLFGDILSMSRSDLPVVLFMVVIILAALALNWTSLLSGTVNEELARAEGLNPGRANFVFFLSVAGLIAVSMKIVGALLITALLIIPAAAARQSARTPEQMVALASIIGVLSVLGGLYASARFNTPSGSSIIVAALMFFVVSLLLFGRRMNQR